MSAKSFNVRDIGNSADAFTSEPHPGWSAAAADAWSAKPIKLADASVSSIATPDTPNVFKSPDITKRDVAWVQRHANISDLAAISDMRTQIAAAGRVPDNALLSAVRNNRVVGVGDVHGALAPQLHFATKNMQLLKDAGITHLAVELPTQFNARLDSWNAMDKEWVRSRHKDHSGLVDMIDAAKSAGIKVVGLDEGYQDNAQMMASRDRTMSKAVGEVLKDESAKVLMFVGAEHLQSGNASAWGQSAADILKKKQVSVVTFFPQLATTDDTLAPLAADLKSALNVPTKDAPSIKPVRTTDNALSGTSTYGIALPTYGRWDNVLFFPKDYGMQDAQADLKSGASPNNALLDAVAKNDVLLIGETPRPSLNTESSQHRQLMAGLMPDLKKQGVTDLAIDLPSNAQASLDSIKSGNGPNVLAPPYGSDDFTGVLKAAADAGIKVHAIGDTTQLGQMSDVINGLADRVAKIKTDNGGGKLVFWGNDVDVATFKDAGGQSQGLAAQLRDRQISAAGFVGVTTDYTVPSLTLATALVSNPVTVKTADTKIIREVNTPNQLPLGLFDNVIIYPNSSQ